MKFILLAIVVCATSLFSYGQSFEAIGHTYSEVVQFHYSTGGVKVPKTTKLETGNVVLTYDLTDETSAKKSFSYFFIENKCVQVDVIYLGDFTLYKKELNKMYQAGEDSTWLDVPNNLIIKANVGSIGFGLSYQNILKSKK